MIFQIARLRKSAYRCQFPTQSCGIALIILLLVRITLGIQLTEAEDLVVSQCTMSDTSGASGPACSSSQTDGEVDSGIPAPAIVTGLHIRSPLARAVFYKLKEDEQNRNDRHVYVSNLSFKYSQYTIL